MPGWVIFQPATLGQFSAGSNLRSGFRGRAQPTLQASQMCGIKDGLLQRDWHLRLKGAKGERPA